jgi:hypothetical protein
MKLLPTLSKNQRDHERQSRYYRNLIHREAKIGGELFGPIPANHRREFFWLEGDTWIWHEEWTDPKTKQQHIVTTRYDIRPSGVLKSQDGQGYRYIDQNETRNLYQAIKRYKSRVTAEVYGVPA